MPLKISDWNYRAAIPEGDPLDIEGVAVWPNKWHSLKLGALAVPHPNFPQQRHKLWPYVLEADPDVVLFLAGELSNGVWCFYVPAKSQPSARCKGMTVNERLNEMDLSDRFDRAIRERDERVASDVLIATGLTRWQAIETVTVMFADPGKYGYA